MADDLESMYDTDELDLTDAVKNEQNIAAVNRGMVTEIDINGRKIEVVNPEYARELQRLMLEMSNKMRTMDRNFQSLGFAVKQQARIISDLRSQLAGKIDRE